MNRLVTRQHPYIRRSFARIIWLFIVLVADWLRYSHRILHWTDLWLTLTLTLTPYPPVSMGTVEEDLTTRLTRGHNDPEETDLDYYSRPENYTGSNLQAIQRLLFVQKQKGDVNTSIETAQDPGSTALTSRLQERLKDGGGGSPEVPSSSSSSAKGSREDLIRELKESIGLITSGATRPESSSTIVGRGSDRRASSAKTLPGSPSRSRRGSLVINQTRRQSEVRGQRPLSTTDAPSYPDSHRRLSVSRAFTNLGLPHTARSRGLSTTVFGIDPRVQLVSFVFISFFFLFLLYCFHLYSMI